MDKKFILILFSMLLLIPFVSAFNFGDTTSSSTTVYFGNLTNITQMADVNIVTPTTGEGLIWNAVTGAWENGVLDTNWNANYSTFLTHITWANVYNGTMAKTSDLINYNSSGLIIDWNSTGYIKNWLTEILGFNYYNSTTAPTYVNDTFGANYSTYLTKPTWATVMNGTLMLSANWNATNTSYARLDAANPFGAFNQTFDTNTLFIDSVSDRVGIGTTAPTNKFHIEGDAVAPGTYTTLLRLSNSVTGGASDTDTGMGSIDWQIEDGNIFSRIVGVSERPNTLATGALAFYTNNHANGLLEKMRIDSSGNVGIGTTGPVRTLDVNPTARTTAYNFLDRNTWADLVLRNPTDTDGAATGIHFQVDATDSNTAGAGIAVIKRHATGGVYDMSFIVDPSSVNPIEAMVIQSTGNVGIGTTAPGNKLAVEDTSAKITVKGTVNTGYGSLQALNSDGDNVEYIQYGRSASDVYFTGVNRAGGAFLGGSPNTLFGIGTRTNTPLLFATNNLERVRITNDGNVGIGTTNPSYKLTVGNGSATNYSLISAYFEGNITSAGYITRTSTFDKSKGSALNLIQDSDYYKANEIINHSKFYGYTSWNTTEIDYSKPTTEEYTEKNCSMKETEKDLNDCSTLGDLFGTCEPNITITQEETCIDIPKERTIYNETKQVKNEGVLLDKEIDVLRQAVYELKLENQELKARLTLAGIK